MKTRIRERIYLSLEQLEDLEIDILNRRHVERYAMVRQWCFGKVIDVACGCGYGSFLIAKNPDVKRLEGYDINTDSISFAKQNFKSKNLFFIEQDIREINTEADVLVSLETIEHLKNPEILLDLANRCGVKKIIVSYPSKKTTHYNPNHFHDFKDQDLITIFEGFAFREKIDLHRECEILIFER